EKMAKRKLHERLDATRCRYKARVIQHGGSHTNHRRLSFICLTHTPFVDKPFNVYKSWQLKRWTAARLPDRTRRGGTPLTFSPCDGIFTIILEEWSNLSSHIVEDALKQCFPNFCAPSP
ncbi:hypothetical protein AVEN_118973-1, partial [Araneus ventricosus]